MAHSVGEYSTVQQMPIGQTSVSSSQTLTNNPSDTQSTLQPHPESATLRSNAEACKRCCVGNCLMSICRIFVLIVTFGCVDIDPPAGATQEQPINDIQNQTDQANTETPISSQTRDQRIIDIRNRTLLQTQEQLTQEPQNQTIQANTETPISSQTRDQHIIDIRNRTLLQTQEQLTQELQNKPNVVTYNTIIDGYIKIGSNSQINQVHLPSQEQNVQKQNNVEIPTIQDPLNLVLDTSSGLYLKSSKSDTEVGTPVPRKHRRSASETHIQVEATPKGLHELQTVEEVTEALDGYPFGTLWKALEQMSLRSPYFTNMETHTFVLKDENNVLKQRWLNPTYSPTAVIVNEKKCVPANWIRLPNEIPFIACQAPLPGDESFFAMLEQYKVKHIVVLVNEEVEPHKVHAYWKREEYGYAPGVSDNVNSHYKKHRMVKGEATIFVHQYLSWPDHGVPTTTESMKEFLEKTHEAFNESSEPVVVHCSAGMGRGGTYIATHYLKYVKMPNDIADIAKTVVQLRSSRIGMIQTEDQFEFMKQMMGFNDQDI